MITSFKRNYLTLARSCFCKGKIFRKSSSLLSIICSMRSLDAHETVLKKKMKLLEIAGNENKKTNRNSSYFLLSSWASSLKGFWISTLVPMFQGNLIAQDHSVIYIYIYILLSGLPRSRFKIPWVRIPWEYGHRLIRTHWTLFCVLRRKLCQPCYLRALAICVPSVSLVTTTCYL